MNRHITFKIASAAAIVGRLRGGSGFGAHDVAQDLHANGCDTTIIQHNATTVININPTTKLTYGVYEGVSLENGDMFEIHGNEHTGYEIRHGNRSMKSRFKNIDEATMAIEMFRARQRKQDQSADYIEEA